MDHQLYESWLLDDEHLTKGQERELRLHLKSCLECAALARSNRVLRAAPMSTPPAGFALRFQERLAAERKAQRLRNILGVVLVLVVGMGVVFLFAEAYLTYTSSSPAQLTATAITNLMLIGVALRTIGQAGNPFAAVTLIPLYIWALVFMLFVGVGVFWIFSSRRFVRFLQSRRRRQSATPGDQG